MHRASDASLEKVQSDLTETTKEDPPPMMEPNFLRQASSFLRVADLDMVDTQHSDSSCNSSVPNFHHISVHPPPGIEIDDLERWVALDDGYGNLSPMASAAIQALTKFGLSTVLDQSMWHADYKTNKLLSSASWKGCTFDIDTPILPHGLDDEILVWSGKFRHNLYGSELPAVRSAAVIHMPADALMELLVDSARVQEYNAMSMGRQDLLVLQDARDGGPFGGVTKVVQSESRPPLLRKNLRFTSLFHARRINDGWQLVTRAVKNTSDAERSDVLVSEILMGVNLIRRINDESCCFVSVNHIRSPMVPMMIAKRVGLQAAVNFIHDLRKTCCH
jgi:hypothetical protein